MPWPWRNLASSLMVNSFLPDWFGTLATTSISDCSLSEELDELLDRNKEWATNTSFAQPKLFPRLAKAQNPKILWIGCSDSRVPETEIFRANPGDFFVHRNIANVVREDDASLNSVLQYSIDGLNIKHIIVCGHYCCGGVKAAMDPPNLPAVNDWIKPISDLYQGNPISLMPLTLSPQRRAQHRPRGRGTGLAHPCPLQRTEQR
ncbi:hypothetical protein DSO57_1036086 [Entomophthora muscae]|uniref:Uncharacterized protein n=1 Tax=Entomophthora muscae TaxID=34485 RepID=A0ACC2TY09_9FUNG|nr:hypothetical protein DSO57_1036086 [Entomophthora muscae]